MYIENLILISLKPHGNVFFSRKMKMFTYDYEYHIWRVEMRVIYTMFYIAQ